MPDKNRKNNQELLLLVLDQKNLHKNDKEKKLLKWSQAAADYQWSIEL